MPAFVAPCLATFKNDAPAGDLWVHEIKYDGYRIQARIEKNTVQLLTRSGLDWTHRFRSLAKALRELDVQSALIDGEAVVEDERGASSFASLVNELKSGRSAQIVYLAFDLLHLDGRNVMALPLVERKILLKGVLDGAKTARLRYSDHLTGDGKTILAEACKLGLEGIISKRLDLPYRSGRRDEWRKLKCLHSDEFVIAGYLDSTAIKDAVGALALGFYDGSRLIYAGRVGTGFSSASARSIWQQLQSLRTKRSPLATLLDAAQRRDVRWVEPKLVAQIDYWTRTGTGLLRHASFKALREDVRVKSVRRPP